MTPAGNVRFDRTATPLWTARGGYLGMWRYGCGAEQHRSSNKREQSEVAKLVIVESPAKARTIGGYLGKDYVVESSFGHIRDLPNNAADTPAKIKDKPWGRLAVDVDNGFEPYYVVPRDKKSHIAKLKKLLKDADELYLATDDDREGEAIAWHLLDELAPKGIKVCNIEPAKTGADFQYESFTAEEQAEENRKETMLRAEDIAVGVHYVLTQPRRSVVQQIVIAPRARGEE